MRPELFRLLDVSFPSYFVLLLTGFVFATIVGALWARRIGKDPDVIVDLGLGMLISGVAGGRILHVFADGYFWDYVHLCTNPSIVDWHISAAECLQDKHIWDKVNGVCHPASRDCLAWAKFWAGGLAYYGGLIVALITAWFMLKRDRFPFWKATDMSGCVIPLGLAYGRMGCLLAGCCFGVQTTSAAGLAFPPGSPASEAQAKLHLISSMHARSLPVHPTQLYEAAACLGISAFCLFVLHPRKRYDGHVLLGFIVLYGVMRFVVEYWRADDRGALAGLSTSQWISIALIVAAGFLHLRFKKRALGLANS